MVTSPPTLNLANINLILKKDKPSDICGSYRPISLIVVDSKLLSKLLDMRLEKLLTFLINPDQTGFIQNRFSSTNVRRLLNIIQYSSQRNCRAFAISLDAEKAFDRIEWKYLFNVLERFGIAGNFLKWIKTLYHSPMACVMTNGVQSPPFTVHRGTRQGCPLSPLLFALAFKPLAEVIRSQRDVHGVTIGGKVHSIALYADDILLFFTKPDISIPATLSIIHEFGSLSGYKINFEKSEAMPLGNSTVQNLPPSCSLNCTIGG